MRDILKTRESNKVFYLTGGKNIKTVKEPGVEIVTYTNTAKQLCSLIWYGKQSKPSKHYAWATEEKREKYVQERLLTVLVRETDKKVVAARKKAAKEAGHPYKTGTILYGSWGYDQTNIDYWQITRTTGKTLFLRRIHSEITKSTGWASAKVVALKDEFYEEGGYCGKEYKKVPQCWIGSDGSPQWYVKSPIHGSLWEWDGTPKEKSWYA